MANSEKGSRGAGSSVSGLRKLPIFAVNVPMGATCNNGPLILLFVGVAAISVDGKFEPQGLVHRFTAEDLGAGRELQ